MSILNRINPPVWLIRDSTAGYRLYYVTKIVNEYSMDTSESYLIDAVSKEIIGRNARTINPKQEGLFSLEEEEGKDIARYAIVEIFLKKYKG